MTIYLFGYALDESKQKISSPIIDAIVRPMTSCSFETAIAQGGSLTEVIPKIVFSKKFPRLVTTTSRSRPIIATEYVINSEIVIDTEYLVVEDLSIIALAILSTPQKAECILQALQADKNVLYKQLNTQATTSAEHGTLAKRFNAFTLAFTYRPDCLPLLLPYLKENFDFFDLLYLWHKHRLEIESVIERLKPLPEFVLFQDWVVQSGLLRHCAREFDVEALKYFIEILSHEHLNSLFVNHNLLGELFAPMETKRKSLSWFSFNKPDQDCITFLLGYIGVNHVNVHGESILHKAMRNVSVNEQLTPRIKFLLEKGANPNLQNEYGNTPLHCYLQTGEFDIAICQLFCKHGANINLLNDKAQAAFDLCSAENKHTLVALNYVGSGYSFFKWPSYPAPASQHTNTEVATDDEKSQLLHKLLI